MTTLSRRSARPGAIALPSAKGSNNVDHVAAVERSTFDAGQDRNLNEQVKRPVEKDEGRRRRLRGVLQLYHPTLKCPNRAHVVSSIQATGASRPAAAQLPVREVQVE